MPAPRKTPPYPNASQRSGNPMHRGTFTPPPRPNPSTGRPGLTLDQWAKQQADKVIAAQIAAIQEAQRLYTEELQRAAQERIKQGQALASWMQGQNFPGRIQGVYQLAGNDVAGYAQGFSGGMRDIASADAAVQTNMLSGTGQEGAVRNEGEGMGDVMYGAYGWSPAKSFAESGAAFASDAALQPSFAAQFAAAEAAKIQQDGLGALKDFALQMAEARAGKGDLVQKFRELRQGEANDRFKQRMEILKWQSDEHYRRFLIYRDQGKMKLANQELALAQRKQRQAEMEASRQYGLAVQRENRLGQDAKTGKKKTVTVAQARDSMKDVVEAEEKIREEITKAIKSGQWQPSAGRSPEKKALIERLMRDYKYLALTPQAKKRLRQIIIQAVNEAGRVGPPVPSGSSSGSSSGGYDDFR